MSKIKEITQEILNRTHPQVIELLKIPQYEQRSAEWFAQRADKLTSSDVDTVLKKNKYQTPLDILFKKCGMGPEFEGNEATRHGAKYENEAIEHYCRLYNKETVSFGLLPHPTISWLGGSPDDITLDGIVVEVKCPLYRNIEIGTIPEHYISQIKMNMEICNLDKAVFIEYKPSCVTKKDMILNVVHLDRDPEWFNSVYKDLEDFWNQVLYYRQNGINLHEKYEYMKEKLRPKKELDLTYSKKNKFVEDSESDESEDENDNIRINGKLNFRREESDNES